MMGIEMKKMRFTSGVVLAAIMILGCTVVVATENGTINQEGDYFYSVSCGVATITGYTGAGGAITIPSTLGGYAVVAISNYSFYNSPLTSVTIPKSVTLIGVDAFIGCASLTSFNVDEANPNFVSIDDALYNKAITTIIRCPSDKSGTFSIPNRVTTIGDNAFYDCTALTSVIIPDNVTFIGEGAFWCCSSLVSVNIPSSVISLGNWTFGNCISLTSATITSNVAYIGENIFVDCINLTAIDIDGDNKYYTSVDGVLYDKTVTTLYECPSGKTGDVIVPNNVTTISYEAFSHCSLTSVIIPNSVTSIGVRAFWACPFLTSVTIPNNITTIGERAFMDCISLTTVTIGRSVDNIGCSSFSHCPLVSILFLGMVAPTNIGDGWIADTPSELRGHAFDDSNFPSPGEEWNTLMMGTSLSISEPIGLMASSGNDQVIVNWTCPRCVGSNGVTSYNVYRSTTENGTYILIASVTGLIYIETKAIDGQAYWYKVSAVDVNGEGSLSSAVSADSLESGNPSNDSTMLILGGIIAIAVTLVAVLFVMNKKRVRNR
jgi:hypothetical protein